MNDKKTNLDIQSFIVFDPTLSEDENDDEGKILYYHPSTISLNVLTMTIGLCEAMCNFAREFTNCPCQYIHTMKTRIVLHKLENNIFMILTINIPKGTETNVSKTSTPDHKRAEFDGYLDEEIQNSICESIISHCRQMFYFFKGPPSLVIQNSGIAGLRKKMTTFFDRYITQGMFENYQMTDGLTGVQYLVVDKDICTNVETIIRSLETKFPDIFCSMLLFNNSVIHSTVNKEDLGILYRYLTTTVLAKFNVNESMKSVFSTKNMGRFLSNVPTSGRQLPKVFFRTNDYLRGDSSSIKKCYVLVYKSLQVNVVLFIEENTTIDSAYLDSIDEFLGPLSTNVAQILNKNNGKINHNVADSPYRYIYWNPETLSLKCTLFPVRQLKSDFAPLIPIDTIKLMGDIKQELDRNDQVKEMAVKLDSDSWVSSLKENRRELLVAINKRNFSLVDVSKEMKHICNRDFPDLFRLDCD